MKKKVLHAFSSVMTVCVVVLFSLGYPTAEGNEIVPPPYAPTGFPQVVVVSGTDFEMGKQYAEQTAPAIVHNLALMKSRLYDKFGSDTVTNDMKVWDHYTRRYDPGLVDWMKGIQAGCKARGWNVSYLDMVILMVYPSENWARPDRPYPPETMVGVAQTSGSQVQTQGEFHSCNSFAATGDMTTDGYPVHSITQMVGPEAMDTVILLAFPTNGASFVSQPYSGRVNGNHAMNSEGFAWTLTAISQWGPDGGSFWGLITEVYFHYLAQIAKSPDEAIGYLQNTPRAGVTGGITMSDKFGNIKTFECNSTVEKLRLPGANGEDGNFLVMTNHLVDPELDALGYNPPWAGNSRARYDSVFQTLSSVAGAGVVDFSYVKKLWEANYSPGSSINQSIFFPKELIAYLQTGTPTGIGLPAYATGEYVKIRLATDPKTVAYSAGADASALYWDARNSFQSAIDAMASYLTTDVYNDVQAKLDEAYIAITLGSDRAGYADLQENQSSALWGEALTYYAKAQLYSQMAKTAILRASVTGTEGFASVDDALNIKIPRLQCGDLEFEVSLDYYLNPADPANLYWKLKSISNL
jgi:hypothetical protein